MGLAETTTFGLPGVTRRYHDHNATGDFMETYNYKIKEPFSLINIFEKAPCREHFQELLVQCSTRPVGLCFRTIDELIEYPSLAENFKWLLEKGFIESKRKRLVPGTIFKYHKNGSRLMYTNERSFIDLMNGRLTVTKYDYYDEISEDWKEVK